MPSHDRFAHLFRDGIYFANPAGRWRCRANENANGPLRQYFPRSPPTDLHYPRCEGPANWNPMPGFLEKRALSYVWR